MKNSDERTMPKWVYWTLCTFLIIFLFLAVGGTAVFFIEVKKIEHLEVLGVFVMMVGFVISLIAIVNPIDLVKTRLRGSDFRFSKTPSALSLFLAGVSFIIGGEIYRRTGNLDALIIALKVAGVFAGFSFVANKIIKK